MLLNHSLYCSQNFTPEMSLQSKQWYFIYLLRDPESNLPIYIGKALNPIRRFGAHLSNQADLANAPLKTYMQTLCNRLLIPQLEILAWVEPSEVNKIEADLIRTYSKLFNSLLNIAHNKGDFKPIRKHGDPTNQIQLVKERVKQQRQRSTDYHGTYQFENLI